jgi:hypothetical protein
MRCDKTETLRAPIVSLVLTSIDNYDARVSILLRGMVRQFPQKELPVDETVLDVQNALRNVMQQLQCEPRRYRLFGIWWWPIKAQLKQPGYGPIASVKLV